MLSPTVTTVANMFSASLEPFTTSPNEDETQHAAFSRVFAYGSIHTSCCELHSC